MIIASPFTSSSAAGVRSLIPTKFVAGSTYSTPPSTSKLPVITTLVKSAAAGTLEPITVPSMSPPLISTLLNVLVPLLVTLPVTSPTKLPLNCELAVIVVPVIAAGIVLPIIVSSIVPPVTLILLNELEPVLVILPVTSPVTLPSKSAVITPAAKSPLASRATIVPDVFKAVASLVIVIAPVDALMLKPVPLTAALVTPSLVNVITSVVAFVVIVKPVLPANVKVSVSVSATTVV